MNARPPLLTCLVMLVLFAAPVAGQQTPEELFQSALYKQQIEGDLEGAKEILETLIEDYAEHREVAASALVLLGRVYETLGSTRAERAYRRVLNEYPDQRAAVDEARARLASLEQELAELRRGPTFTKIEIASKPQNGVLSSDGEMLAFVSQDGVWVMPLHGNVDPAIAGEPVRVADVDGAWDSNSLLTWSADGRWIAVNGEHGGPGAVYVIPASGGDPRVVRTPKRGSHPYAYRLSLSPDGGTLAFSALGMDQEEGLNETEKRFIYTVSVPGGEPRKVTNMWGRLPAFSPDGKTIAYASDRQIGDGDWESDLWLVPATGGQPVRVISAERGRIRGPVWSPEGDMIAAHYEPGKNNYSAELWIIPLTSADTDSTLTKITLPSPSWNMLAGWTPDDQLGVFMTTPGDIGAAYTVPASGGKAVRVTPENHGPSHLAWSTDGTRIYAQWQSDEGDSIPTAMFPEGIGFIPAEGGEVTQLPLPWGLEISPGVGLDVSPDGREIVFMGLPASLEGRPSPEDVNIWTASVNGAALTQLTDGPCFDAYPSWSPDGRWIAFVRLEESDYDRANIQLIPASGGPIQQITSNADSAAVGTIAFSPDGTRIAYFADNTIKTVPVQGGRSEILLEVGKLHGFPDLDWSPDGRHIVYMTRSGGNNVMVASLDTGRSVELTTGLAPGGLYTSVAWSPDGERIAFVTQRPTETGFWLISDFLPRER